MKQTIITNSRVRLAYPLPFRFAATSAKTFASTVSTSSITNCKGRWSD